MVTAVLERLRQDSRRQTRHIGSHELPAIMRKHIVTGMMGMVYLALMSGMFLVAFGTAIGFRPWHWGLMSSGMSLMLAFQLVSAYVVGRTGNRRTLWFGAAVATRLGRGLAIVMALWLSQALPDAAAPAFIMLMVASAAFGAFAGPPWFSWLTDIIPRERHGAFMGRRRAWTACANLALVLPAALVLDYASETAKVPVLLGIFAVALAVGMLDLFIHRTIPEPPMEVVPRKQFWHEVTIPLRDERFRPWLAFRACWMFSWLLGGSVCMAYFVENLGIKRNFFGGSLVLILLPLLGAIFAGRFLGAFVDTHGVRRTLTWGHRAWAVVPLFWLLAGPDTALWWLAGAALMGGTATALAMNAATKLTTRVPERQNVAMYVAASTCVGSLGGALGGLTASGLLYLFRDLNWQVGGVTVVSFHVVFLLSLLMRNASTVMLRHMPEPGSPPPAAGADGNCSENARSKAETLLT